MIVLLSLVIDLSTKLFIHSNLARGEQVEIVSGLFNLNHVHNPGAAFGFLSDLPSTMNSIFFLVVTMVAVSFMAIQLRRLHSWKNPAYWAYSLIIGGALGNSVNRAYLGYVVDFLDLHWNNVYHFPSFNMADVMICTGGGLLLLRFFEERKMPNS